MFYIKSLPPKNPTATWTYNRFGEVIPDKEIEVEIQSGQFRRDLYYRLNHITVQNT